jgi:orotidine-5'-phosphate decarboxylase
MRKHSFAKPMNSNQLFEQIRRKRSFLCIGLDSDITKIPTHLFGYPDPLLEFNRQIIEATHDLCVAYKPNMAFYESRGFEGWVSLERTMQEIPQDIFTIADAKRGDIGNTSTMYAKGFFDQMNFDAITLSPYMGHDSVTPYFNFADKWAILLALTSNEGAADLQMIETANGPLWQEVLRRTSTWGTPDNMMYVIGATKADMLAKVRQTVPEHFLLVPGVGAQGGSLSEVARNGMNSKCGLLVNSSRAIIYAGDDEDFAETAREAAKTVQLEMAQLLEEAGLL